MDCYQVRVTFRDYREVVRGRYTKEWEARNAAQEEINCAWADSNIISVAVERVKEEA